MNKLLDQIVIALMLMGIFAGPRLSQGQESFDIELARSGSELVKKYCHSCHGVEFRTPKLDVTDRFSMLDTDSDQDTAFLVPGNPDDSQLWDVIDTEYMPPEEQPQPTAEERNLIKTWIAAGANFPPADRPERDFIGEDTILLSIENDLRNLPESDLPYIRYFSLAHLWNDIDGNDPTLDSDLTSVRAGLSKLLNSLSNRPRIVVPRAIDENYETIYAIDIRDYGWDLWHWNELEKKYPYGLKVTGQTANLVYRLTGTRIPYLRADWFLSTASRPPLYHDLLNIPQNAKSLELSLGISLHEKFMSGQLARAAFQKSGVSKQNRMLERSDAEGGGRYYWKSYDMLPGTGEVGDFTRRPLGPLFEKQDGRQIAAFEHDGGEIIWSLPNGLQGYMLVDGHDARIDQGPPAVVFDPNSHSGTFLITNGISCMGCHKHGMISWERDEIRPLYAKKVGQTVADKVLDLYPPDGEMMQLVKSDQEHFMRALEESIGPFLNKLRNGEPTFDEIPEPITQVSKRYQRDVSLKKASAELGLQEDTTLQNIIGLRVIQEMGLSNWANPGGTVSREAWEKAYGRCARELGLGIPIRVR